jgi:putative ABC transport system permease protein
MPDGSLSKQPTLFQIRRVSPNYLSTIGIPLLGGRQFDGHDDAHAPAVTIISRRLAEHLWPGESAIGKRIYRVVPGSKVPSTLMVVGVAGNTRDEGVNAPPSETVYVPWSQLSTNRMSLVVRPRDSSAAAIQAMRHALRATNSLLVAHDIEPLDVIVEHATELQQLQSALLLTFAVVAIVMAILGCYGVMRQLVAIREREYAMRLVFGAAPSELGWSVLHQAARLTIPGVGIGLVGVVLLGGVLRRYVFGVEPRSILVLAGASAVMLIVGVAAALPAAVRAMRVDIKRSLAA